MTDKTSDTRANENRDPITGAPGAHPVGTGIGAAAGGLAAGAAAGTLAGGPVGAAIGAAAGAIIGGLAGKAVAEHLDPTAEEAYWRDNYQSEPYFKNGMDYDDYAPAYRLGYESRGLYSAGSFEDVERDLANDYQTRRGRSRLSWDHAKAATRAAWDRVERNNR